MKLPNGYGGIHKLSGNRRKPWCARKTMGWEIVDDERVRPVYKYIGYFKTKKEALQALAEYNANPYEIGGKEWTLGELYDEWSKRHFEKIKDVTSTTIACSWKALEPLHNVKVKDLNFGLLQDVFDKSDKNRPTLIRAKSTLGQVLDYAVIHEYVGDGKRELIRHIEIRQENVNKLERTVFTADEIDTLWEISGDNKFYQIPLMLLYSGLRISELLDLKAENVHLKDGWFFVEKTKTAAGVREVPIADKIMPFFESWGNGEYFLENTRGNKLTYPAYLTRHWKPLMKKLSMEHSPHDTRHTFVSLLTERGADARIIKQLVGHASNGVTESVYTHINIESKRKVINML